ncbi:hypothetical protein BRADI_1g72485v3 [Brachypodium distachyon]|uniref:Uncharacterized protein n=1 Tax=Brachypodium distachyon TaxID=15368 RepID=A0A0Q3LJ83_BRADI|nr:hypothetical protein BRADI_1g72485v3 [Brachypodium distachyon]
MPQTFLLSAFVLLLAASTLPISYSTSLQPIPISTAISQYCSRETASSTPSPMAPWSPEEDARLTYMVMKHGAERWSYISTGVPGRTGKSCRRRWCNHLSLAVQDRRAPFAAEEHVFGIGEARAGAAAQFAHTNAAAAASASAAAAAAAAAEKGKAVVIDVEEYEEYAGLKVNNEPPPAKRQRVSNEGEGSASAGVSCGDADDAWLTLSLGLPQHQQQQQPVEQAAPMAPVAAETPTVMTPVAAETPTVMTPAVVAAMREMVREEVQRQASQLVASVFMAARAGQL